MTRKKVSFGPVGHADKSQAVETWVATRDADAAAQESVKRLNILLPVSLHVRIKTECAKRGTNMSDEIRTLLERAFPEG